jgi:hypothetical protein
MPPIFSTAVQTQHPCGQIELQPDRDSCFACCFLIYSTVSVAMHVKRVNTHRDMNSRHGRRLRWFIRLLRLIGREGS